MNPKSCLKNSFKVNFFGKDTLLLELLSSFFQRQGIFVCEKINVENENADLDVHLFEDYKDYFRNKISDRAQIFIFSRFRSRDMKFYVRHNVLLICDFKVSLDLFEKLDFDLLIKKKFYGLLERGKRYIIKHISLGDKCKGGKIKVGFD